MKSLNNILNKIKENPDKYIGKKSITHFNLFITGYIISQYNEKGEYPKGLDDFQQFVQKKYDVTYTKRWCEIIRFFSVSEEYALDEFFNVLEEFLDVYQE